MRILIIVFIGFVTLVSADLVKSGSFVIDKKHKLVWQDTKANKIMLGSQDEAIEYCEKLTLGSHSNWQLPTREQYQYIIDKTRKNQMMIDKSFKYVIQEGYWTADRSWRSLWKYGYYVFIKSGNFYYENRTYKKFFRCVRETK